MNNKAEALIKTLVAVSDHYGDEYDVYQVMQDVADVCRKHFAEVAREAGEDADYEGCNDISQIVSAYSEAIDKAFGVSDE